VGVEGAPDLGEHRLAQPALADVHHRVERVRARLQRLAFARVYRRRPRPLAL
jgi:hypothetical protein